MSENLIFRGQEWSSKIFRGEITSPLPFLKQNIGITLTFCPVNVGGEGTLFIHKNIENQCKNIPPPPKLNEQKVICKYQ